MLRELAVHRDHLAPAADPPAAAHRVEVDAERARGIEHGGPLGEPPPPARGGEDDERLVVRVTSAGASAPAESARGAPAPAAPACDGRAVAAPVRGTARSTPRRARRSPIRTSAAITAWRTSSCSGDVIALVIPFAIAIARNAPLIPLRFGSPNEMFDAPQVVFTPSSSWRRRTSANTCRPAVPIAPIGITSGSTTTSAAAIPWSAARSTIRFATANRTSGSSLIPVSSFEIATTAAPCFATSGSTCSSRSSSPVTEFTSAFPS